MERKNKTCPYYLKLGSITAFFSYSNLCNRPACLVSVRTELHILRCIRNRSLYAFLWGPCFHGTLRLMVSLFFYLYNKHKEKSLNTEFLHTVKSFVDKLSVKFLLL